MRKAFFITLPWILFIGTGVVLYQQCSSSSMLSLKKEESVSVINHQMVVDRIESMGKLELVKFYIKDIVEHNEIIDWWPDSKAVLLVSGEVVGCIDLTKVDSSDIYFSGNNLHIVLPEPEICYNKVNHKDSKVYDVKSISIENFFPLNSQKNNAMLIDKAYTHAEQQIQVAAKEMNILGQTKDNARLVLMPLLQSLSEKKVTISFKDEGYIAPSEPAEVLPDSIKNIL